MSETVQVARLNSRGMITLKGDLADQDFQDVAVKITGLSFPSQREIRLSGEMGLAWMAADEVLLMLPVEDVSAAIETADEMLRRAPAVVANVTDARVLFSLKGKRSREVLAKLAPVDLSREAFQPGQIRRTRLAQVAAAFWMPQEAQFEIMCFRSVADYVTELLEMSAAPGTVPEYF